MTDMVERYLAAVGRGLPDEGRADILAELGDELLSMVEAREAGAGRPLERAELGDLLKDFGHPLIVAGRYRKVQHLVGPAVFPFWWATLKIVLGVIAGLYLVAIVLKVVFDPATHMLGRDLPDIMQSLLIAFGAVTLSAVLIEQMGWSRHLYRWSPRELPAARAKSRSPFEISAEIGIEVVFLAWWTGQIQFREIFPTGAIQLALSSDWAPLYWPVIAFSLAEIVINILALLRPDLARLHAALGLARSIMGAALITAILSLGSWVRVTSLSLPVDKVIEAQGHIATVVQFSLAITLIVFVAKAIADLHRLWREVRH